jgi:hypothetical protein
MNRHQFIERLLELPRLIEVAELALLKGEQQRQEAEALVVVAEDALLIAGVEGKNSEQRAALVREQTKGERLLLTAREQLVALRRVEQRRLTNELAALRSVARLL